jgi:hypothetical protein
VAESVKMKRLKIISGRNFLAAGTKIGMEGSRQAIGPSRWPAEQMPGLNTQIQASLMTED